MKKIALMLALLFTASVGFNAVAADSNAPANTTQKNDVINLASNDVPLKKWPDPPYAAEPADTASGAISGTTIGYIIGIGGVVAALAVSTKGTTGTH